MHICSDCGKKLTGQDTRYIDQYVVRRDKPPERIRRVVCAKDYEKRKART